MSLFQSAEKFKKQDYNELKKQQASRGVQFVDDEFPVENMAIHSVDIKTLEFKRPTEVVSHPCICSDDSYFSLKKGFIENFNILLAFSSLKTYPNLWKKVFVDYKSQNWSKEHPEEHSGIFKIRFWQDGFLVDVTIDDRLPFQNGKFVCTMSSSPTEFWPAILEKAYAKLLGGYDNLEHARLEEILMDLTGGVTECISLQYVHSAPPMKRVEFYEKLEEALKEGTIVLLCTQPPSQTKDEPKGVGFTDNDESSRDMFGEPGPMDGQRDAKSGLCARYGYLLTRVCAVPKDTSVLGALKDAFRRPGDCSIRTRLLRLRSPLTALEGGAGLGEWTGAYSEASSEWEALGLDARKRLRLSFDSEAEFWIPLDAVVELMAGAVLCRLPDTGLISLTGRTWQLNEHHGAWYGDQTGGSLKFRDTFLNNPQYVFDITSGGGEEVILALIRKYVRDPVTLAIEQTAPSTPMGMGLFQVEKNRTTRMHRVGFAHTLYVEEAKPFRVSLIRKILNPGRYVVIPFLNEPLSTAAYLLRLYLPKRTVSKELTLHIPRNPVLDFFTGSYKQAVRLHLHSATNLLWPDGKNPPSPYCTISSEDNQVRSFVCTGTNNPVWNEYFIFYRRRPKDVPLVVQIMDKRAIGADVFLGRHSFTETEINQPMQQEVFLFGRDTKDERFVRVKGSLSVEFYSVSSEDFLQI
ncbi:unnamed protein product [Calicophoron daubneyi]|uniref:Calpain-5 n=1 Tax=Calicophoron daubneyi TaxID=300641 RepID=A0AAV2T9Z3_CALDB